MWIARNSDGLLRGFEKKPIKTLYGWYCHDGYIATFQSYCFPEIKWEDEEPRELVLKVSDN